MEASGEEVVEHVAGGPVTVPQPQYDPYFSANEKVIQDLLLDEKRYHSTPAYCFNQPVGVAKWMRRTLLNWLRDVCVHRQTDAGVLAQTAQLIDRYLHVVPTDKREYQLVGSTCFFIASKLKETVPVSLGCMVKYTDYSVIQEDIVAKELTICLSLKWDLSCITPVDFFAPVVDFLEFAPSLRQIIRQAALNIFIKAFHVEDLGMYLPSYVSAACILYALNLTVHPDLSEVALRSVTRIQQLLKLEARKIREVYQQLQACFEPGTVQLSDAVIKADSNPPPSPPRRNIVSQSINPTVSITPLATSTQLQPRRLSNTACCHSHSLSSVGGSTGSSSGSFDQTNQQLTSYSLSTSSPSEPDGPFSNDIENEQPPQSYAHSQRRSMSYVPAPHFAYGRYRPVVDQQQLHHPNVNAAGQTLIEPFLMSEWENRVASLMGPLLPKATNLMSLKAAAYPNDPPFFLLTASDLRYQTDVPRLWAAPGAHEVKLDQF